MGPTRQARVAVLLALYNGADTLPQQLESIRSQELPDWHLLVADDGSSDESLRIAEGFAKDNPGKVEVLEGPCIGLASNFVFLLQQTGPDIPCVAFCDQDDIWLPDKLQRGLDALSGSPMSTPALYCSSTWIWRPGKHRLQKSTVPGRPLNFKNALVQNVCSGNTIMLNRAAIDLLQAATKGLNKVLMHDWFFYQVIAGAGGRIVFDPEPTLLYRQSSTNAVGANGNLKSRFSRLSMMWRGRLQGWNEINLEALHDVSPFLTPENQGRLRDFLAARNGRVRWRILNLVRSGVFRQRRLETLILWLAALTGRI